MQIFRASWGGRGEHGILEVFMERQGHKLILSLCDRTYSDWGSGSQVTNERTGSKSYDIGPWNLTRRDVFGYIIDLVQKEYHITDYVLKEENLQLGLWG